MFWFVHSRHHRDSWASLRPQEDPLATHVSWFPEKWARRSGKSISVRLLQLGSYLRLSLSTVRTAIGVRKTPPKSPAFMTEICDGADSNPGIEMESAIGNWVELAFWI